jgi:Protein of unknown function (DUF2971)
MNNPQILYKYRDWSDTNHREILYNNKIYLSSPRDFNDPYDCKIHENWSLLYTEVKVDAYINNFFNNHKDLVLKQEYSEIDLKSILKAQLLKPEQFQKVDEENIKQVIDLQLGIFSVSTIYNNNLMWSHYGKNHTGFCIGFRQNKLSEIKDFGSKGFVVYQRDYPQLDPLDMTNPTSIYLTTHIKSIDWLYESEFRFIKFPTIEQRKLTLEEDTIVEIILGVRISEKHREEITEICKPRKIKLFQLQKSSTSFVTERIEIL